MADGVSLDQTNTFAEGDRVQVTIDVDSIDTGFIPNINGTDGTEITGTGENVQYIVAGSGTASTDIAANGITTGAINSISAVKVDANGNPTNVLDGGRRESATNLALWSESQDDVVWIKDATTSISADSSRLIT